MSFFTNAHLIFGHETKVETVRSERGAWLLLSEDGDGGAVHRINLTLNDLDSIDRMLDALGEAQAMLVDASRPPRVAVGSDAA